MKGIPRMPCCEECILGNWSLTHLFRNVVVSKVERVKSYFLLGFLLGFFFLFFFLRACFFGTGVEKSWFGSKTISALPPAFLARGPRRSPRSVLSPSAPAGLQLLFSHWSPLAVAAGCVLGCRKCHCSPLRRWQPPACAARLHLRQPQQQSAGRFWHLQQFVALFALC